MSWDRDALWNKAVLFMRRASAEDRDGQEFGLWAAMGLELLARAAVSKTSPALLAEPDKDQKNLLHAFGAGVGGAPKSISVTQVISLCRVLIPEFTDDEFKAANALFSRRNEEVHTGSAAFSTFQTQNWLPGFYRCCKILSEHQGESLESLLGNEEALIASETLGKVEADVVARVKSQISAHAKVFESKEQVEQDSLAADATKMGDSLSYKGYHRVVCPACKSVATVQGTVHGGERIEHKDGAIVVRQNVVPTRFSCPACGLKLTGYPELHAAGVGDHFTHRSEYSPDQYYNLIDPNDPDELDRFAEDNGYYHFSND